MREHFAQPWTFRTKNFEVRLRVYENVDLDLSWDETGEVQEKLDSGELIAFDAEVQVAWRHSPLPDGYIVAWDSLSDCIYGSVEEFIDHRVAAKETREHRAEGRDVTVGSYFADMVRTAVAEARVWAA